MFRIIKNGASIGLTENLNYIKQAENGCYVLCPEPDASGIVFGGTVYQRERALQAIHYGRQSYLQFFRRPLHASGSGA